MKKISALIGVLALLLWMTQPLLANTLPAGNFLETCINCKIKNTWLRCKCQTRASNWIRTTLNIPPYCSYIQNYDGRLTCTAYNNNPRPARRDHRHHLYEVSNGPIWNQNDADHKCPQWCAESRGRWTGQWTTKDISTSVCQCKRGHRLLITW